MTYQRNETPEPLASATPITEAFEALMPEPVATVDAWFVASVVAYLVVVLGWTAYFLYKLWRFS